MADVDPFADLDIAPADDDAPPPEDGPRCEECNDLIPWSGRGRKPRKCDAHKSRTSPRTTATGAAPRRGSRLDARLATVEQGMFEELVMFGKAVAGPLPVFGLTAISRAERTAKALSALAARNERLLLALEASTQILPALQLGETAAALGVALLVDIGRMHPDGVLPLAFGVSETWHEINDETDDTETAEQNGHIGLPTVAVPPRFAEVK